MGRLAGGRRRALQVLEVNRQVCVRWSSLGWWRQALGWGTNGVLAERRSLEADGSWLEAARGLLLLGLEQMLLSSLGSWSVVRP